MKQEILNRLYELVQYYRRDPAVKPETLHRLRGLISILEAL